MDILKSLSPCMKINSSVYTNSEDANRLDLYTLAWAILFIAISFQQVFS